MTHTSEFEAKIAKEKEKQDEKKLKETEKFDKEIKKLEYQRKIHQMNMETMIEINERREYMKQMKKTSKPTNGLTGD